MAVVLLNDQTIASNCAVLCINNNCNTQCVASESSSVNTVANANVKARKSFTVDQDFSAIRIVGVNATLTYGSQFSIVAQGQTDVLEKIDVDVRARQLFISLESGKYEDLAVDMQIVLPELKPLTLMGSNQFQVRGFSQAKAELSLQGSNRLIAPQNSFSVLQLKASGANHLDWLQSQVETLAVELHGRNIMSVNMQDVPDAQIRGRMLGVDQLRVCGKPQQEVATLGIAKIVNVDC